MVVIVCRDHLIQNAFHPLLLLSLVGDRQMHYGITFINNRRYCDIISRWVYTTPLYKIIFLDSRPRQTRYVWLGSSNPEPLFVSDPTLPLHFTPKQVFVRLFLCKCVVFILFKTPFTLSFYYHSKEIATYIVVSHLLRDNRKYCGITSRWVYIPPPYRSYSSTRDLVKTRYGLLGSLTPEPLFVNDPTPPLHLTLNEYLYDLSWSCKKLLFIISAFLRHYIHRRTPHLPSFSHFPRPPPSPHS